MYASGRSATGEDIATDPRKAYSGHMSEVLAAWVRQQDRRHRVRYLSVERAANVFKNGGEVVAPANHLECVDHRPDSCLRLQYERNIAGVARPNWLSGNPSCCQSACFDHGQW